MAPRKRPWLRLYVEIIWDRKIRRRSYAERWLYVAMLAMARQSPVPGFLMLDDSPMHAEDIADAAAMKVREVEDGLKVLQGSLIDFDTNVQAWFFPNWNERQYESDDTTKRTTKHRRKNVPSNDDVAPPENREQKTDTEAEVSGLASSSPPTDTNGHGGGDLNFHRLSQTLQADYDLADVDASLKLLDLRLQAGEKISSPVLWARAVCLNLAEKREAAARADEPRRVVLEDGSEMVFAQGRWWDAAEWDQREVVVP
jgi:hypothetical protein